MTAVSFNFSSPSFIFLSQDDNVSSLSHSCNQEAVVYYATTAGKTRVSSVSLTEESESEAGSSLTVLNELGLML